MGYMPYGYSIFGFDLIRCAARNCSLRAAPDPLTDTLNTAHLELDYSLRLYIITHSSLCSSENDLR